MVGLRHGCTLDALLTPSTSAAETVRPIVVWGEGYHWRCRMFDKSINATNASGPDLDCSVLPIQQAVVRCRNSVKVEDLPNLFFIHSIFVQTLSDMCVLLNHVRQGEVIQPRGWMCVTRLHLWLPRRPVIEWANAAGPHMAWAGRKCWPVDQRFRPARTRRDDLLARLPLHPRAKWQRISTKLCLWLPQRQIS